MIKPQQQAGITPEYSWEKAPIPADKNKVAHGPHINTQQIKES